LSDRLSSRRGAPRARNLELAITLLVLLGALPAVVVAIAALWRADQTPEVRWTLLVVIVTSWWAAASAARQLAVRSLNLIANLLARCVRATTRFAG
jgi:hypothetical protein